MFPLTKSVRSMLDIYRSNDTIRPDTLVEHIERIMGNPKSSLTSLFNYLLAEKEQDFDLLDALASRLKQRYFVHIVPRQPILLSKKCHIKALNFDPLVPIASKLEFKDLIAFGGVCKNFRAAFHLVLEKGRTISIQSDEKAKNFPFQTATNCSFVACSIEGVKAIGNSHPHLAAIHLHQCEGVRELPFPNLKSLSIFSKSITDRELLPILENAPNLQTLSLNHCSKITGLAVATSKVASQLRKLELECTSIQAKHLQDILNRAQKLVHINLSFCELTKADFQRLVYPASVQERVLFWTAIYNNGPD